MQQTLEETSIDFEAPLPDGKLYPCDRCEKLVACDWVGSSLGRKIG
jgi:hypothetical protein